MVWYFRWLKTFIINSYVHIFVHMQDFFTDDFFSLLVVAIGTLELEVLYSSSPADKSNYISLALVCACEFVWVLLPLFRVGYNLFNRQARHILALSCCPRLLLYYKWLWNIYKHHKFNLCRRCARRVYCAHNKRSTEIPSRPNSTRISCSRLQVIYYFYTFNVFVWHALSTLYKKRYSAKIAAAITIIY